MGCCTSLSNTQEGFMQAVFDGRFNDAKDYFDFKIDPNMRDTSVCASKCKETHFRNKQYAKAYFHAMDILYLERLNEDFSFTIITTDMTALHLCGILARFNEMEMKINKKTTIEQKELLSFVEFLFTKNIDPNLRDWQRNTALHFIARTSYIELAQILLNHNARLDLQNRSGQTALDIATKYNQEAMAKFLETETRKRAPRIQPPRVQERRDERKNDPSAPLLPKPREERCVLCNGSKREYIALPCQHTLLCKNCDKLKLLTECPLCQKKIETTYLSE